MNGNINNNQQKQWYLHQFIVGVADKEKMSQYFKKNLEPNGKYTYLQTVFKDQHVCQYLVHTKLPNMIIKGVNFLYSETRESHETSKTLNDMVNKTRSLYIQPNVNNAINNNMNMQNRVHQNQMQINKNKINIGNNKIVFGGNAKNVVQKKQDIANPIKNKQDSKHEKDNVGPDFLYFGSDNKVYTGRLVSSKMAMMKLADETFIEEYKKRCISADKQQKYFVLNSKVQKQVDELLLLGQYTRTPCSSGSCHIINSEYYEQRYKELYKQLREIDYEPSQQIIVNRMVSYELLNKFGKGLQRK
ncbi:MAG: hypothetical protein IJ590_02825 [Rickettsiales bacterium]|nr:hypothetical protein [Rickettsiales bacterium]